MSAQQQSAFGDPNKPSPTKYDKDDCIDYGRVLRSAVRHVFEDIGPRPLTSHETDIYQIANHIDDESFDKSMKENVGNERIQREIVLRFLSEKVRDRLGRGLSRKIQDSKCNFLVPAPHNPNTHAEVPSAILDGEQTVTGDKIADFLIAGIYPFLNLGLPDKNTGLVQGGRKRKSGKRRKSKKHTKAKKRIKSKTHRKKRKTRRKKRKTRRKVHKKNKTHKRK
tara:strand:- start:3398 stop:4066 length:669 start_codon:yes stop_codon:yes gene_type:complete